MSDIEQKNFWTPADRDEFLHGPATNENLARRHRNAAVNGAASLAYHIQNGAEASKLNGWRVRIKASITLWKHYRAAMRPVPMQQAAE